MVLAIGYAASALGPVIAGVVRDVTGSFDATLLLLPAIGGLMIALSALAPERSPTQSAIETVSQVDRESWQG